MRFTLIIAIALAAMMALFALQNSQHTQVTFLGWYFDGPLVIILLLAFVIGVLTALLTLIPGSLSKTIEISRLKSRINELTAKIDALEKQNNSKPQ